MTHCINRYPSAGRFLPPHFFVTCFIGMMLFAAGCKKDDPIKYWGKDVLYFINIDEDYQYIDEKTGSYDSLLNISFYTGRARGFDTVFLGQHSKIPYAALPASWNVLRVKLAGKSTTEKRKYTLQMEGSGTRFCVLPPPDSLYIPANSFLSIVDFKIARPPVTDTNTYVVTLTLTDNESFTPSLHRWRKFSYVFGNFLVQPARWPNEQFGTYSRAKLIALVEAVGWASESVRTKLKNDYLAGTPNQTGKRPQFEPFTFFDFYLLLRQTVEVKPNAWKDYMTLFAGVAKDYITNRKNEGKPVLDDDGHEITFP